MTPTVTDIDQFKDNFWGMLFMATSKYKFSHQRPNVHALRALKERDWSKEYNSQDNIRLRRCLSYQGLFNGKTKQCIFKIWWQRIRSSIHFHLKFWIQNKRSKTTLGLKVSLLKTQFKHFSIAAIFFKLKRNIIF